MKHFLIGLFLIAALTAGAQDVRPATDVVSTTEVVDLIEDLGDVINEGPRHLFLADFARSTTNETVLRVLWDWLVARYKTPAAARLEEEIEARRKRLERIAPERVKDATTGRQEERVR